MAPKHTKWIHVLLKGERPKSDHAKESQDLGYIEEFAKRSLDALHVPLLEFEYKNLNGILTPSSLMPSRIGLILTSPRAVEWVRLALENNIGQSPASRRPVDTGFVDCELVFVIGPKTADECAKKLRLIGIADSIKTGNSAELARVICDSCRSRADKIKLLYPKSSLADDTIEKALENIPNVTLEAFVAYETTARADVREAVVGEVVNYLVEKEHELICSLPRDLNQRSSGDQGIELTINFIFFSPSGVDAFCQLDLNDLISTLDKNLKEPATLVTKYSSIGKTTELALRRRELDVFCVASKPNAQALVDELVSKCHSRPV